MLLAALRGRWTLSRRIVDPSGAVLATVENGEAEFADFADEEALAGLDEDYAGHLLYRESGDLRLPTARAATRMTRAYLWSFARTEGVVDVRFYHEPGVQDHLKFFHRLSFPAPAPSPSPSPAAGRVATASHLCEADLYSGRVELDSDCPSQLRAFVQTWEVKGPAKDYVSTTEFGRAPE